MSSGIPGKYTEIDGLDGEKTPMTKLEHRDFDSLDHTKAKWWWVDSLDLEKYITFGLSGKHGNKIGSLGLQYHHTPHPKTSVFS